MDWPTQDERALWRDIMSPRGNATHPEALYWFARLGWGIEHYIRDTGSIRWFSDSVHYRFLCWLQNQIIEWKESRRAGNVELWQVGVILPRDFGKTVAATKAAGLWMQLDEPNMSTAIGSEVHPKAKSFLKPIKEVIQGTTPHSWFTWLFGCWYAPEREWSGEKIEHAYRTATGISEPSFDTFGVDKGITGYHPLVVIFDDPISRTKLKGPEGGQWLRSAQTAHDAIYNAVRKDGLYMLVGNRYLIDDVIGKALADDGVLSWDGMPCPISSIRVGGGKWRVFYYQARDTNNVTNYPEGEPTLPNVWSHDALKRAEKRDASDYAAELMNDPATGEHMPLTMDQIRSLRIPRDKLPPIEYATVHCDTAYKSEERRRVGDDNVIAVWLHDLRPNGVVYFDGARRSNAWRAEEFEDNLIATIMDLRRRMIRVRVITADRNPGGIAGLWKNSIVKSLEGAGLRVPDIQEINREVGPVERIRLAASFWVDNYVRTIDDAAELGRLEEEMARIGYVKPKDLSSACADVFGDEKKGHDWHRKAQFGATRDLDEGAYPRAPGDDVLKSIGRRPTDEEALALYDEQHQHLAPKTDWT